MRYSERLHFLLLSVQETQVSNFLHVQERQVLNAASCTGDTDFKYSSCAWRHRFQMLLYVQETQVSNILHVQKTQVSNGVS
jgi:hypothetical protein